MILSAILVFNLATSDIAQPQETAMTKIDRLGATEAQKGPAKNFTGNVWVNWSFAPDAPARAASASVTFEPGARSAWHSHPLGQTIIVTDGVGWHRCGNGPKQEIRAGDRLFCPPGERHWHGATPDSVMTHIVVQEAKDGKVVDWYEKVDDADYLAD